MGEVLLINLSVYSYYQAICKELSECADIVQYVVKSRCGERGFSGWPQWLAVVRGGLRGVTNDGEGELSTAKSWV